MAINYNSNRVKHLKYNGSYVKELNYNGTITWEETFGTWVPGTLPTGLSSISCSRTSSDPAISAGSITSGAELYNKDVLSFMLTPEAYWTTNRVSFTYTANVPVSGTETTLSASTVLSLGSVTLSRAMRTITVTVNTGVSGIYLTYKDSTGTTVYKTFNSSGSVSAWAGAQVTWTAAPTSGYTLDSSSGTIAIGYGAGTIAPTATVSAQWYTTGYNGSATWSGMTTATSTTSNLLNYTYYSGLNVYPKVRVSGTITMTQINTSGTKSGYGTYSFSNVELTVGTSGTQICQMPFTYKITSTRTGTGYLLVYIKNSGTNLYASNQLSCYMTCSSRYSYVGKVTISISKVEVYTKYSSQIFDFDGTDDYGIRIESNVNGSIGMVGGIEWSSYAWSSASVETVSTTGSAYIDDSYVGGTGDQSLSYADISAILLDSSGEGISAPARYSY